MKSFEDLRSIKDVRLKSLSSLDNWRLSFYERLNIKLPPPNFFLWQFNFKKDKYVFILEHMVLLYWGCDWINQIKRKYGDSVFFVLTLFDSMSASSVSLIEAKEMILKTKWDLVYSFDKKDVEMYGWKWLGFSYFSSFFDRGSIGIKNDAYFVGGLKGGRTELIMNTAEKMEKEGVDLLFELLPPACDRDNYKNCSTAHIHYLNKVVKYHRILDEVRGSNCIVEILQKQQHCQSYRYFEAIYYNKKLLTNNPDVVNYPFYNPDYIKIFKDISEIDCEWIKKREQVDYGYNNEFSPVLLLDMIKKDIHEIKQTIND